jgi:hypothetical protein
MSLSRFANCNTHERAAAAALQTVTNLVVLKNVPLNLEKRDAVGEEALGWLTTAEVESLAMAEREGVAALTQAVNRMLDMSMIGWTFEHICARAGMCIHEVDSNGIMEKIVAMVETEATDKTCLRWPDIGELADRFYANLLVEEQSAPEDEYV